MEKIPLNKLLKIKFPPEEWIVEGIIPARAITIISAPPESYKTWALLLLADAVSNGDLLFDRYQTTKMKTLFIDEETTGSQVQKRMNMLNTDNESAITFMIRQGFQADSNKMGDVLEYCKREQIGLVIIDSFVRINPGDENDASRISKTFNILRKFVDEGITLVISHHNRKPGANRSHGGDEMRGSSDILAAVDCHLVFDRPDKKERLVISQNKNRIGEQIEPIEVYWHKDEHDIVTLTYAGAADTATDFERSIQSEVMAILSTSLNSISIKELSSTLNDNHMSVNRKTLSKYLNRMEDDGIVTYQHGRGNSKLYSLLKE